MIIRSRVLTSLLMLLLGMLSCSLVAALTLLGVSVTVVDDQHTEVVFRLSEAFVPPSLFTTKGPTRVVIDFDQVDSQVVKWPQAEPAGLVKNISTVAVQGRTRAVISAAEEGVEYQTSTTATEYRVLLSRTQDEVANDQAPSVLDVDFRRGESGEARLELALSHDDLVLDMTRQGRELIVTVVDATVAPELRKRLDVLDFATTVKTIDLDNVDSNALIRIDTLDDFDYIAYQADKRVILELRALDLDPVIAEQEAEIVYEGDKLSLNFQDIEVRSVLQLIADFTELNIVTSDTVQGNITLRLKNVPWDQALDIILRSKGLDKRQDGNVLLIAPADELAAREQVAAQSVEQAEKLAALQSELIQVNYSDAAEIGTFLQSENAAILSDRGQLTVDARTNTIFITDTAEKLEAIRTLVKRIDVPVGQVLIESRVVVANRDQGRDIGTFLFASKSDSTLLDGGNVFGGANLLSDDLRTRFGLTAAELPGGILLDLELQALESEGVGEIISSPRVITADRQEALIESGEEIPYVTCELGDANDGIRECEVEFRRAVLSLRVTPQVTPDDKILLTLQVQQDSRGETVLGLPAIDTQNVQTQVLVDNGDTIVIGGIYRQTKVDTTTKVPVLGNLPLLGKFFTGVNNVDNRQELIVFVTPRIIKESLSLR